MTNKIDQICHLCSNFLPKYTILSFSIVAKSNSNFLHSNCSPPRVVRTFYIRTYLPAGEKKTMTKHNFAASKNKTFVRVEKYLYFFMLFNVQSVLSIHCYPIAQCFSTSLSLLYKNLKFINFVYMRHLL